MNQKSVVIPRTVGEQMRGMSSVGLDATFLQAWKGQGSPLGKLGLPDVNLWNVVRRTAGL